MGFWAGERQQSACALLKISPSLQTLAPLRRFENTTLFFYFLKDAFSRFKAARKLLQKRC